MNGFGKELRGRILGVVSHVTVTNSDGGIKNWPKVADQVQKHETVLGVAPYIHGQGMATRGKGMSGVVVRGILPTEEPKVSILGDKLIAGSFQDLRSGEFGIIVGKNLAWKLGLALGAQLSLVIPVAQVTPAGLIPRFKRFTVVGIFDVDMYEYDSSLVLIHMSDAARLYRLQKNVTGLRLKIEDLERAPLVSHSLSEILGPDYNVRDWTYQHANFFRALKIEKTVMFVILMLIIIVAAINIISTLVMVVRDKEADIAVLRTQGATPKSIMAIFIVQGAIIGIVGTLLGAIGGIALALNIDTVVPFLENLFSISFVAGDVYLISELPSDMHWDDVFMIVGAALILGLVATLYPAWRASKVQPAEALRYE